MTTSSDDLSPLFALARFQAALNTTFDLPPSPGAPAISLKLIEVDVRSAPKGFEQFAAIFEGPAESPLTQGTYIVTHPAFGAMPLFVVPVARSPVTVSYEACVVRRIDGVPAAE